ncbi:MAG: T9SS type A sorting domain-containing protein [Bacteroidetes bacterium]|nr:T9SS type A sorting domain-containing protein [Bacteroidota bacterium]
MKILTSSLIFGLIVICLIPFYGIAQSYKNVCLTNNTAAESGTNIIKNENNEFFILSFIRPFTNSLSRLGITKTDSLFNPLFTKLIGDSTINYFPQGLSQLYDSTIILVSSSVEFIPNNHSFTSIIKMNYQGDTIWTTNIKDSTNNIFLKLIHTSGDSLFFIGTTSDTSSNGFRKGLFYIYNHKTNSKIFAQSFNKNQNINFINGVSNNIKNTFNIYGISTINTTSNFVKPIFLECKSDGTLLSSYTLNDTINTDYVQLINSKKTGNTFIGFERFSANQVSGYVYLIIDTSSNITTCKRIYNGVQDINFFSSIYIDTSQTILISRGPEIISIDSTGYISGSNYTFQNSAYPLASIVYYDGFSLGHKSLFIGNAGLFLTSKADIAILEVDNYGLGCSNAPLIETSINFTINFINDTLTVDTLFDFEYSHGISLNSHTLNQLNLCPNTSINSQIVNNNNDVLIYPNPTFNSVKITTNKPVKKISVYTIAGHKIFQDIYRAETELNINLDFVNTGLYMINILFEDNSTINKKFIKL